MKTYYMHNGQNEQGPFTIEDLKTKNINESTPIWYDGAGNWTTAGTVAELKDILVRTSLPPKFDNFSSQTKTVFNPPIFSKPVYERKPKKKKTLRNILIGVGVVVFLFFSLVVYATVTDTRDGYDEAAAPMDYNIAANDALTEKNRNYRNTIEEYVTAGTNKYSVNEFGGISNLDIIVTNSTDYLLNEVNVNVNYIKDNGGIYKSELVVITNIPAHQDKSASAPESDRGTSVAAKIQTISSKTMHMCYDNSYAPKVGTIDPYFCR